jgi:FkbM family methyltransferase
MVSFKLARFAVRTYPFVRGRHRLAGALIGGRLARSDDCLVARTLSMMPEGAMVRCRHGIKLRVYRDYGYIDPYLFGEYDHALTALISRVLRPGDVVFDVGANFGWFTALSGRLVGSGGKVHAFEPVPRFVELVRETIALNHLEAVACLNASGLGAFEGSFDVFTFVGLPMGHASATPLGRDDAVRHRCAVTTLDGYARSLAIERIAFIKVDVEGHERDVFIGGQETLARNDAIVIFEINKECLADRGLRAAAVWESLVEVGYTTLWELRNQGRPARVDHPSESETCNYLAAKPTAMGRLRGLLDAPASRA